MKTLIPGSYNPPAFKIDAADHRGTEFSAILLDLEQNLRETQGALLNRDIAALEHLTQTQQRLTLSILAFPRHEREAGGLSGAVAARVLQLGRIQIALLAHARSSLRMIDNLLARADSDYSDLASAWRTPILQNSGSKRDHQCRV